LICHPVLMPA